MYILNLCCRNNLLTEEEKRNIGSPINFFLDVMSRQEAERRLSSGTTVASEDSATSITPVSYSVRTGRGKEKKKKKKRSCFCLLNHNLGLSVFNEYL